MGQQSSRIYIPSIGDHKDIYFNGKYHDKMYIGSQLVWEKQSTLSIGKMISTGGGSSGFALINPSEKIKYTIDFFGSPVTNASVLAWYETNRTNSVLTFHKICDVDKTDTYLCLCMFGSRTYYLIGHKGYYDIESESKATFIKFSEQLPEAYRLTDIGYNGFYIGDCLVTFDGTVTHASITKFYDSNKWSPFYSANPQLVKQSNVDIIVPSEKSNSNYKECMAYCNYKRIKGYDGSYGYKESLVAFAANDFSKLNGFVNTNIGLNYIIADYEPTNDNWSAIGLIRQSVRANVLVFSNGSKTFTWAQNYLNSDGVYSDIGIEYNPELVRELDLYSTGDNAIHSYIKNDLLYLAGNDERKVTLGNIKDVLYSTRVSWYSSGYLFGNTSDLYYVPYNKYDNITKVNTIYAG